MRKTKIVFNVSASVLAKMLKQSKDNPGRQGVGLLFVKDQGVYLMPNNNVVEDRIIKYAVGCNPDKNQDDWYENARHLCGGDDFGEFVPAEVIEQAIKDKCTKFIIGLTPDTIEFSYQMKA